MAGKPMKCPGLQEKVDKAFPIILASQSLSGQALQDAIVKRSQEFGLTEFETEELKSKNIGNYIYRSVNAGAIKSLGRKHGYTVGDGTVPVKVPPAAKPTPAAPVSEVVVPRPPKPTPEVKPELVPEAQPEPVKAALVVSSTVRSTEDRSLFPETWLTRHNMPEGDQIRAADMVESVLRDADRPMLRTEITGHVQLSYHNFYKVIERLLATGKIVGTPDVIPDCGTVTYYTAVEDVVANPIPEVI